jgi:hypothetical protein
MYVAKRIDSMEKFLGKAENFSEEFPEESLNNMRKFAEVTVKELGEKNDCLVDGKHWFSTTTKNLQNHLPARLFYYIQHIQCMGNYGSHFQEDGVEPSAEDIQYCIYAGREIFQWIFPELCSNTIEEKEIFITEIFKAAPCSFCGSEIGKKCVGKSPGVEWPNLNHDPRKKAYAKYRRDFQKHYATTLVDAMHEMISDIGLTKGELIRQHEIIGWFNNRYPAYNEKSVAAHTRLMATNMEARYSHTLSKGKDYNLFFRLESGKYRLFDSEIDPLPLSKRPESVE